MPLTPNSRVYEQKLERTRKKYESRNAFATERSRKAREESFSSPTPKDNRTSVNRFGMGPVTHKDGLPDFLFQKAVEAGIGMAKDTGISAAQILNESANLGGGRAIFGKDYIARGAGKLFGQEAQNTVSGEVTPMDILNAANLMPGIGSAAGKGASSALKLAQYLVPKTSKFEPAMALASGGMTTRTPIIGNIKDVVNNYANASRLFPSMLKMFDEETPQPYDIPGHEDYIPESAFKEIKGKARYTPPEVEQRIIDEQKASIPKNLEFFKPTEKTDSGNWASVEIPAIDEKTGLTTFDSSEIRAFAFGGIGDLVKGTPLENLGVLKVPDQAQTIRAIYEPPSAKEVLKMMKRTDAGVASRPNVKNWTRNNYTLDDAQQLLDRWSEASTKFEEQYGHPLPWKLEADVIDPKTGKLVTKRIFGQDVEHGVPVNQGGTGAAKELTLLPTIANTGKRDYSWEEYAAKYPEKWNALIDSLYGDITRY